MNKEDFIRAIEESRKLVKSGKYTACPCSQKKCEWHGKCFECVMIHRTKKKHLPECLQPIFRDAVSELAAKVELAVVEARPEPELFDYLHKVSPPEKE